MSDEPEGTQQGPRRYAPWPMFALALVVLVDAVDVSILRGVLPLIKKDWQVGDFALGLLGFAFIIVHTFTTIPAGWMADRYRRTRIIGATMLTWSALSAFAAASVNYAHLFVARAALGMGQAVDDPSSTALLADYYPARMRGRVFSIQQVMQFIGGGLGLALGGFIGTRLGWRWAFLLVGTPGVLIAFVVFRLREPKRGEADHLEAFGTPPTGQGEARSLRGMPAKAFLRLAGRELATELRSIFAIRTMRYILVGVGVLLFTVTGVGYWLAVYHDRYSGMTLEVATVTTGGVLAFGGIAGTLLGGRIADRVYGQGPQGRIVLVSTSIITCTVLFIASYNVPLVPARLALQFFGVFAISGAIPGLRASMTDVIPAESRGVGVSAFSLASAVFGQALAPPIVGLISDLTGSLLAAFYIVSPPVIIGALILLRARKTIAEDAAAIVQAIMDRNARQDESLAD